MRFILILALVPSSWAFGLCPSPPGPHFPTLTYNTSSLLSSFTSNLTAALDSVFADTTWNASTISLSIELTDASSSFFSYHHTAELLNAKGNQKVDGNSIYRLGSMTKVFTVLGILLQGPDVWEQPITKYLPELLEGENEGGVEWEEITVKALASQISGLAKDAHFGDLADPTSRELAAAIGLPDMGNFTSSICGVTVGPDYNNCTRSEYLSGWTTKTASFPPFTRGSYSDGAYNLLGYILTTLSGSPWSDTLVSSIFTPLSLNHTFTGATTPPLSSLIMPAYDAAWWDTQMGYFNPTGGGSSSSSDLAAFTRAIISHQILPEGRVNAWLKPVSGMANGKGFFGAPWEVLRTPNLVEDRVTEIITKGGGMPGYYTLILFIPEYGIAGSVLVAGDATASYAVRRFVDTVMTNATRSLETIVRSSAAAKYAGRYTDSSSNSSMVLTDTGVGPFEVSEFFANGVDVIAGMGATQVGTPTTARASWSGLGEKWVVVFSAPEKVPMEVFGEMCVTDVDLVYFGGKSLGEIVFDVEEGVVKAAELTAWRLELVKES